jgi:hypothetical protein
VENEPFLNAQWKPGQSGNPKGRPAGATLTSKVQSIFIAMMERPWAVTEGKEVPYLDAYIEEFLKQAITGGWSARILAERIFKDDILKDIEAAVKRSRLEDMDFLSYRFAHRCSDMQAKVLASKCRTKGLMCGRRAGKTENLILLFGDRLSTEPNSPGLYVAKKLGVGIEQVFTPFLNMCEEMGIGIESQDRAKGDILLPNGSSLSIRSNDNRETRESMRGGKYRVAAIDEAQSQPMLKYLCESIIGPMLEDMRGELILCGSGPRAAGTYWEEYFSKSEPGQSLMLNWSIAQNPFIDHYEDRLREIREEKKLDENSSLYQREYLGKPVYDIDALVYRLQAANYFTDADLGEWLKGQPAVDIAFTAGLDYGYSDSDAISIVCHSTQRKERFLIWEYKLNHTGIEDCAAALKLGMEYVQAHPLFQNLPNKGFYFFADSGGLGKKISYELATHYALPILDAYKVDKPVAIELLQQEIRQGTFKVRKDGYFDQEAIRTVFERDDKDNIVRVIDDSTYHPDVADSVLYAMRPIWLTSEQRLGG